MLSSWKYLLKELYLFKELYVLQYKKKNIFTHVHRPHPHQLLHFHLLSGNT